MLASRLGITRVIPTDAIREVMRAMFTAGLFPTLHTSSYDTARLVRVPLPRNADPVIIGFREQTAAVSVGVEALIQRAVDEGTDLIVEGAHLVPGFTDICRFAGHAVVVPMIVTVDDEEVHRSHILKRASESGGRPADHRLSHFGDIVKLQRYVKSLAFQHGVPVVPSYNLDATLSHVIELVVARATEAVPRPGDPLPITDRTTDGARTSGAAKGARPMPGGER
ncbi:MAG TPA: hypothetical protein VHF24_09765 [Acidimicrobiales bacterium]|nr:hypothetical protein [Acidimicrobiales bacterium]